MDFEQRQDARYSSMTSAPIPSLIFRLSLPTIGTMLITSIYNMADTYFVSQIGTSASAAVGINFSLMAMIQAIGFTFGMGVGSYVSRRLGEKNARAAGEAAATAFFMSVLLGLLLPLFGLPFIGPLVRLLGATETIAPYAMDYARYILIGAPYMAGSFVLNNLLRSQGSAMMAMVGIGTGGILNMILDPIFIFVFGLGIGGAALATILSQLISFCLLLYFNLGYHGNLRLSPRDIRPDWPMISEIMRVGFPSFCRQGLASVAVMMLNVAAAPFGDAAIAAMSIVNRVMMFINSALIGFGQGFQPVCGFNYGAKKYDRVLESFWFCFKVAFVGLTVVALLVYPIAPWILTQFRREDAVVIAIGTQALRLQCVVQPLQGLVIMTNMFLQVTAKSGRATLLATARQGLFFIPNILLLPRFFGLWGVMCAQPISDCLCFLLAAFLIRTLLLEIARQKEAELG